MGIGLPIGARHSTQIGVGESDDDVLPAEIAMWGDSLTYGIGWGATSSYEIIESRIAAKSPARTVYNEGVPGETSTQIKTRLIADAAKHNLPTVIWAGHNNPDAVSTVLADIAAMVDALGHSRYLILSVINGDATADWEVGGSIYNHIASINASLAATYGTRFVDVRQTLINNADPNKVQDAIDITHDVVPLSLRSDTIHLNNKGYQIVATAIWSKINTLLGYTPTGGVVGVASDSGSSKYTPSDDSEWALALAAANISSGGPVAAWMCQENSAETMIDFVDGGDDGTDLNVTGTPSGRNAVTGWTRKALNTTEGVAAMGWSGTTTPNLATTSALLLAYVAINSAAGADREIMGVGNNTDHRYVVVTAAGKIKATGLAGASVTGTATPGTTVHPIVIKVDRAHSSYTVYTDQEKLSPAWTAPTFGGALTQIGDGLAGGAAGASYLYVAMFTGAAAELTDAQVKTLLQTLGWTVAW